jgi:hypothetical protein
MRTFAYTIAKPNYKNMKKILSALFIISYAYGAFAQDAGKSGSSDKKFRVGLKAAPSIAWMKPDDAKLERGKTKLKFGYGLITEFRLNDIASFATGLEIVSAGGGLNFKDSAYYSTSGKDILSDPTKVFLLKKRDYKINYVNIPVSLKMKTNEIGLLSYYGQFGFDMSVRTKARANDEGYLAFITNKNTSSNIPNVEIKKETSFMRLGLNIGLGVEYGLVGSTVLVAGVNFSKGFTNALKKESPSLKGIDNKLISQKAYNNFVALTVGVIF